MKKLPWWTQDYETYSRIRAASYWFQNVRNSYILDYDGLDTVNSLAVSEQIFAIRILGYCRPGEDHITAMIPNVKTGLPPGKYGGKRVKNRHWKRKS